MSAEHEVPQAGGARTVVAMLPNGRGLWLDVQPTLLPALQLDRLAAQTARWQARQARGIRGNAKAVRQFSRTIKGDAAKLARAGGRAQRRLGTAITAAEGRLKRRLADGFAQAAGHAVAARRQQWAMLASGGRRELWDQAVVASAALLMAAYGQRATPLATNNLVVALGLGVWLLGDQAADLIAGKPTGAIRGASGWSYAAPFANLLTGWWLLDGLQHERFVAGTLDLKDFTVVSPPRARRVAPQREYVARVDLSSRVAPEHFPYFQSYARVPVLATIQLIGVADPGGQPEPRIGRLVAEVEQGVLTVKVQVAGPAAATANGARQLAPILGRLQVAWAVDTRNPTA